MSEFSDKPFCVKGGEIIGNVPTIEELAVYIKDYIKNDVYSSEWGTDEVNGATRKALYDIIQELVGMMDILPIGTILMYDGTGIANVITREVQIGDEVGDEIEMPGWFGCNGLVETPNLKERFVRGGVVSGISGGSNDAVVVEHTHGVSQSGHSHTVTGYEGGTGGLYSMEFNKGSGGTTVPTNYKTPGVTVNNEGVSGVQKNLPYFYSVIYIIKKN